VRGRGERSVDFSFTLSVETACLPTVDHYSKRRANGTALGCQFVRRRRGHGRLVSLVGIGTRRRRSELIIYRLVDLHLMTSLRNRSQQRIVRIKYRYISENMFLKVTLLLSRDSRPSRPLQDHRVSEFIVVPAMFAVHVEQRK
jgi:hypothetical protein